eukprot:UN26688
MSLRIPHELRLALFLLSIIVQLVLSVTLSLFPMYLVSFLGQTSFPQFFYSYFPWYIKPSYLYSTTIGLSLYIISNK